jgi:hypothetical protein
MLIRLPSRCAWVWVAFDATWCISLTKWNKFFTVVISEYLSAHVRNMIIVMCSDYYNQIARLKSDWFSTVVIPYANYLARLSQWRVSERWLTRQCEFKCEEGLSKQSDWLLYFIILSSPAIGIFIKIGVLCIHN